MRVISGKAKRILLKTPEGLDTRPTTDRIKETLFNMMNNYLYDCIFLDLFSGSGAIGIEALSRGAKEVVFSEISQEAVNCIKYNLKITHLEENARVVAKDAITVIKAMEKEGRTFDIIFMDPPYNKAFEQHILEYLNQSDIIQKDTIIIVEASNETSFDYLEDTRFQISREKIYKTNKHVFIEIKDIPHNG